MDTEDFHDEDVSSSVAKFEEMVKNKDWHFFDPEELENIIEYYIADDKLKKAISVIEFAREQHPYSVIFIIKKVQVHTILGHYEEGLEMIELAEILEPANDEVAVMKGEIYLHLEQPEDAYACFDRAIQNTD